MGHETNSISEVREHRSADSSLSNPPLFRWNADVNRVFAAATDVSYLSRRQINNPYSTLKPEATPDHPSGEAYTSSSDGSVKDMLSGFGIYTSAHESAAAKDAESVPSKSHRIDFSGTERVLGWGDIHTEIDNKENFIHSLPDFKAHGGTHVAFEFLENGTGRQGPDGSYLSGGVQRQIDDYFTARESGDKETIAQKRRELVSYLAGQFTAEPGGPSGAIIAEELMKMVDATADAGLKMIAIEPRIDHAYRSGDGYSLLHTGLESLKPDDESALRAYLTPGATSSRSELSSPGDPFAESRNKLAASLPPEWSPEQRNRFFGMLDEMREAKPPVTLPEKFTLPRPHADDTCGDEVWRAVQQNWRNATWASVISNTMQTYDTTHPGVPPSRVMIFAGDGHFENPPPGVKHVLDRLQQFGTRALLQLPSLGYPVCGEGARP
jgi:hypothetical protein